MRDRFESLPNAAINAAIVLVAIFLSTVTILTRIPMTFDPAWGFLVLDSMMQGAAFNHVVSPDPANIARDQSVFLTTWSPGQYALPFLFERIGFNLGSSLIATNILASFAGLAGWYVFYVSVGFSRRMASVACLFMVIAEWFGAYLGVYVGGEALLFAAAPWIALLFWRLRALPAWSILPIVGALALLTFLKLSGVIFGLSLLAACALSAKREIRPLLRSCTVAAISGAIFAALFLTFWLSKGGTAAESVGNSETGIALISVSQPIVGPLAGLLSTTKFLGQWLLCPCRPGLPPPWLLVNLALPFALVLYALTYRRLRKDPKIAAYAEFTGIALLMFTLVFMVLYLRGANIFPDDRHFKLMGLMLLPGIFRAAMLLKSRLIYAVLGLVCMAELSYATYNFYARARQNTTFAVSPRGFRDDRASQHTIDTMQARIAATSGAVLYVYSPVLGLEFPLARKIVPIGGEDEPMADLAGRQYRGRVMALYVLLPRAMAVDGRAAAILRSFRDYRSNEWKTSDLGESVAYSAIVGK